ncbi:hypothetical protein WV31_09720 [Magnetospirillum sp. ME-1]|uniref:hypothetical protein n=1 Tax=Magnetospirillum sp. ME-1 TaxID=1639348 RepID=UPI000A17BA26|nr:hypothetical protein [Magnetospirillum sp. ME-1]ARJ65913.1 hypothetical protein WV31_09720 [Magnetospirillum sp. ME-1]
MPIQTLTFRTCLCALFGVIIAISLLAGCVSSPSRPDSLPADWDDDDKAVPVAECAQSDSQTTICADQKMVRKIAAALIDYHDSYVRGQGYNAAREVIKHIDLMQIVVKGNGFDINIKYAYATYRQGRQSGSGDSRSSRLFTTDSRFAVTSMASKGSGRFFRPPRQR